MARRIRVQYPGAVYHVMNRGDRREPIFRDDEDRLRFKATLAEACEKTAWQVHAYCLMPNHFHLVLETPQANLVAGMKWFLGTYTSRFNHRHRLSGHLFGGRYKTLVVDANNPGYLRTVGDYVHLNPVRAKLVRPEDPLHTFRWSSFGDYLEPPRKRPVWLRVDRLLGEYRIHRDNAAGRRHFGEAVEERRRRDEAGAWEPLRRGWYLGGAETRERLLRLMESEVGAHHGGDEVRETDEQKAERIVGEELRRRRWDEAALKAHRKTEPLKVSLAWRLRQETVMTLAWIAQRLHMGCRHTLANCLKARKLSNSRD